MTGIYLVYYTYIHQMCIYMEYTRYIPWIFNFWGFQMMLKETEDFPGASFDSKKVQVTVLVGGISTVGP